MGYTVDNITQNLSNGTLQQSRSVKFGGSRKIPKDSCQYVMRLPYEERCEFVYKTADCAIDNLTILNTFEWVFCDYSEEWSFIGVILMIVTLIFLFYITSVLADAFICPNLAVVSTSLNLPESIAGVTILAFGNGAPDLFTAYAGAEMDHPEMLFAGLTGSGLFVTTLVAGSILFIRPFQVEMWSLLRNVFFYLCTYTILFICFYNRDYTIWHTCGIMVVYGIYLLVNITNVIVDQILEKKTIEKSRVYGKMGYRLTDTYSTAGHSWKQCEPFFQEFIHEMAIIKFNVFKNSTLLHKFLMILQAPFLIIFKMLIPLVNTERKRTNGWCKLLIMINLFLLPNLMLYCFQFEDDYIFIGSAEIQFWVFGIIVGVIAAIIVFFTTRSWIKPKYHSVFAYLGFMGAIAVTRILCSQVIVHLQTIGARFNISSTILAITLLSCGNCLIDFVSNITLAKQGLQNMGFAACYGGPMFNCSLGVSLISIIVYLKGKPLVAFYGHISPVGSLFLFISLISTLIFVPALDFQGRRCFGIYLIALYFTFFILCILMEKTIHSYGTQFFRDKAHIVID